MASKNRTFEAQKSVPIHDLLNSTSDVEAGIMVMEIVNQAMIEVGEKIRNASMIVDKNFIPVVTLSFRVKATQPPPIKGNRLIMIVTDEAGDADA